NPQKRKDMGQAQSLHFSPFWFDLVNEQLWQGEKQIRIRPKPLAVLRYLVEHPGRLVTRAVLLQHVWAGVYVTTTAVNVCVREIRQALGDSATAPKFVETMGQRGYRFIAPLTAAPLEAHPAAPQTISLQPHVADVVGRTAELARLHRLFESAQHGERQ